MLGYFYTLVDGRTECKPAGGAVQEPIKDVMHRHIRRTRPASPLRRICGGGAVCAGPPIVVDSDDDDGMLVTVHRRPAPVVLTDQDGRRP